MATSQKSPVITICIYQQTETGEKHGFQLLALNGDNDILAAQKEAFGTDLHCSGTQTLGFCESGHD
jgi:hypothetical protein